MPTTTIHPVPALAHPRDSRPSAQLEQFWASIIAPHSAAVTTQLPDAHMTITAASRKWGDVAVVRPSDTAASVWQEVESLADGSVSITPVIWPNRDGRKRVGDVSAVPGAIVALWADVDVYDPENPNTHSEGAALPDAATAWGWIQELAPEALVVATGGGFHVWAPLEHPLFGAERIENAMRTWAWAWQQLADRDGKALDSSPFRMTSGLRIPGVGYAKRPGVQAVIVQDAGAPRDGITGLDAPPVHWRIGMTAEQLNQKTESAAKRREAITTDSEDEWVAVEFLLSEFVEELLQELHGAAVRGPKVWMSHQDGSVNAGSGSQPNSSIIQGEEGHPVLVIHGSSILAEIHEDGFNGHALSPLDFIALALIRKHGIEGRGRARGLARGIVEKATDEGGQLDFDVLVTAVEEWKPRKRTSALTAAPPGGVLVAPRAVEAGPVVTHEPEPNESDNEPTTAIAPVSPMARSVRELVEAGDALEIGAGDNDELVIVIDGDRTGIYALVPKSPLAPANDVQIAAEAEAAVVNAKFELTSAREAARRAERAYAKGEVKKKVVRKAKEAFEQASQNVAIANARRVSLKTRVNEDGVELVPRRLTTWVAWPTVEGEGRVTADGDIVPNGRRRIVMMCATASGSLAVQQGYSEDIPRTLEGYASIFPTLGLQFPDRDRQLPVMNGLRAFAAVAAGSASTDLTPTSMGWARLNGRWTYLAPQGSVDSLGIQHVTLRSSGTDGLHESVAHLGHRALPDASDAESIRQFLALTTTNAALQLLAYLVSAVLPESRRPSVLLQAESDSGKTMLACLLLAYLGTASPVDLPVSMSLPADNSIAGSQAQSRFARQSLLILDDFRASQTVEHARATAEIVSLAVQGTAGAIAGVKSNTSRGLAESAAGSFSTIITAEQLPESGVAILNRSLVARLRQGEFLMNPMGASPLDAWVRDWAFSGRANALFAGYLQFIAKKLDEIGLPGFRAEVHRRRSAATSKLSRVDVSAGLLVAAMSLFRDYLCTLTADDVLPDEQTVADAIADMVADTASAVALEDPAAKVIAWLRRRVEAGKMRLSGPVRSEPPVWQEDLPAVTLLGWRNVPGGHEPNTHAVYLGRIGDKPGTGERVIELADDALEAARNAVCPTTTMSALREAMRRHEYRDVNEANEPLAKLSTTHGLGRVNQGGRKVLLPASAILPTPTVWD